MTNLSFYLDFLIALVFILAIGSIILSIFYETYAYYFKHRAKFLKKAIEDVLNDVRMKEANLAELFYAHPQVDLTKKTYRSLPAYISSKNFAQTLIDMICRKYENSRTRISSNPETNNVVLKPELPSDQLQRFKLGVEDLPYSDLRILLEGFINNSEQKVEKLQITIENWFDEYMNRASGWYKLLVQKRMLVLAFIVCIIVNIDFFRITSTLLSDKELTRNISQVAEKYQPIVVDTIKNSQELSQALQKKQDLLDSLYKMNAPIGWQTETPKAMNRGNWFFKILGWVISAIALSFGSPFWFETLSKLINIRKTGIKPQTS